MEKINDSSVSVSQTVSIADVKARIDIRTKAISDYQLSISEHSRQINLLQALNDEDNALLQQASDLKVADAVQIMSKVQDKQEETITPESL